MKLPRRKFLHLAAGAAALPAVSRFARAQAYPARPVTIIDAFAPGGNTDLAARIVGQHMSRTLGQQFIVENVAGAGGTIGSIRAMRAKPDGYTIQVGHTGTHAFSVSFYPNLAFKPDVDFEPIGMVAEQPLLIVARKDFPPKDLKEFIAYVKTNSEKLNMAHAGVGSLIFTFGLLLNSMMGVKPTLVPFNGGAPAMNALVGGQVDYMCASTTFRRSTGSKWYGQGICNRSRRTTPGRAKCPDFGGGRAAGIPSIGLDCLICAEGNAATDFRQTHRRPRPGIGRPGRAQAPIRQRLRHSGQGEARSKKSVTRLSWPTMASVSLRTSPGRFRASLARSSFSPCARTWRPTSRWKVLAETECA
jgi:Tripartite tricarboxylate transporter family receptor